MSTLFRHRHAPSGRLPRAVGILVLGALAVAGVHLLLGQARLTDPALEMAALGAIGGLSVALSLATVLQWVEVRIDARDLHVVYGPLPWPPRRRWHRTEVLGFLTEGRGLAWDVQLHLRSGRVRTLVPGIPGMLEATRLRRALDHGLTELRIHEAEDLDPDAPSLDSAPRRIATPPRRAPSADGPHRGRDGSDGPRPRRGPR